jgi:hypothetical protein
MTDAYVYYFMRWDAAAGENVRSDRRATLEAIKGIGVPLMESQLVVDAAELSNGFLASNFGDGSNAIRELSAQINSVMLRAEARELAAQNLNEVTDGQQIYSLHVGSREMRQQAQALRAQRAGMMSAQSKSAAQHRATHLDNLVALGLSGTVFSGKA